MNDIQAYLAIIDPRLLQHIKGKPAEFVQLFQQHKSASEEIFIRKICEGNYSEDYYVNLKCQTIEILQYLSIISSSKGKSFVKKKYDGCLRRFIVGQKFLNKGQREEGVKIIKHAYRLAVNYDFAYLACEISSILYHDHVYYKPDKKKAAFYAKQVEKYLHDYTAEKKAENYFYLITGQMSMATRTKRFNKAIEQMSQLKGNSLLFKFFEFRLNILYGFHISNYGLVVGKCKEALIYFQGKKGVYSSTYQFLWSKLGMAQMALAHYEESESNFAIAARYVPVNSFNDYILRFYKTLNALHSGDYQKAYNLYRKNRKCRFEPIKEQFAIIEAYMCYLASEGHLKLERTFRLGKYLNETFKAQTDKQGDNISILIAELLVYLVRDRNKFIDRVEVAKKYSYRYLKGKDTKRAKLFIKILYLLPRANFHPTALRRLAQRHIKALESHPLHMGNNVAIEIIPFDILVSMILGKAKGNVA